MDKQKWLACAAILLATAVSLSGIRREPLWFDEAWSMWAVRDGFRSGLGRIVDDVHPPLYFLLLDGWVTLTGESEFSARLLSVFIGLLGLSFTFQIGRRLLDDWGGVAAISLLSVHGFFIYMAREVRMYMLLMSLSSLLMWAYLRWRANPARRGLVIFALTALLYTHYCAVLIIAAHTLHAPWGLKKERLRIFGMALLLYSPWLPALIHQFLLNPNGPVSTPIPTDFEALRWLFLLVSSGLGGLAILPFLLNSRALRHSGLLLLWLLFTPSCLLILNLHFRSVYQLRYISAIIPAAALLLAGGVRHVRPRGLRIALVLLLMALSWNNYRWLWSPKSTWDEPIAQDFVRTRRAGEPTLVFFTTEASLESYYDRQLDFRNQWAIDLKTEAHRAGDIYRIAHGLADEAVVWTMLPPEKGESWLAMLELNTTHGVSYRARESSVLIYRFDASAEGLTFQYGDRLRFLSPLLPQPIEVSPSDHFCQTLSFVSLSDLGGEYSFGLHLADSRRNLIAQSDAGLGVHGAGESIEVTPCLDIPAKLKRGDYYLHVVVYTWGDARRLPVLEGGIVWESYLIMGALRVDYVSR